MIFKRDISIIEDELRGARKAADAATKVRNDLEVELNEAKKQKEGIQDIAKNLIDLGQALQKGDAVIEYADWDYCRDGATLSSRLRSREGQFDFTKKIYR